MASSSGNAMASIPVFIERRSVSDLHLPFGRMQPKTSGICGNMALATAVTRAISVGLGGLVFAIAVPRMGMKLMTTIAEGL